MFELVIILTTIVLGLYLFGVLFPVILAAILVWFANLCLNPPKWWSVLTVSLACVLSASYIRNTFVDNGIELRLTGIILISFVIESIIAIVEAERNKKLNPQQKPEENAKNENTVTEIDLNNDQNCTDIVEVLDLPNTPANNSGIFGGRSGFHRCDGNCSTCPPHYGYRYGRWYYGHGHTRGCQRGGPGGDSRLTYRD